jgi:uncharacterized protein
MVDEFLMEKWNNLFVDPLFAIGRGPFMMFRLCIVTLIRLYQGILSPLAGPCCRFYPTCSNYVIEAVETYGAGRGLWLGVKRLLKCHPFHSGGVDPVPATQTRMDER